MIKNILFDIDDTLFPSTEFSTLARRNALNAMIAMGLDADYDTLESKLNSIIKKRGSNYQGHFDDLCRAMRIAKPGRYIAAAVAAYHDTKNSIQPFPNVPPTLLKLKQLGYKLYIATNGNPIKQWDKLIRMRIALYFDDVFVSEEIGKEKSPGFYRSILKSLGAKADQCLMAGDREDFDIAPAKAVGIKTVRVSGGKHGNVPSKADFSIKDIGGLLRILIKR